MAVKIPTIQELYDQILNDIATEFNVDVTELGLTYQVYAKAQAGIVYTQYLGLSGVQKNVFYDLAEESVLIRYGQIILGRLPSPSVAGEYEIQITGSIGALIPASTQFRADDTTLVSGNLFVVDSDFTLTATTDTVQVRALTAGTTASLVIGDNLTATAPIVNVLSEATVTDIVVLATQGETIEEYRADVVLQAQIEPQGGSPGDYRLWCSEIPEIRNVYTFAKIGSPGDIEIYIEATPENTAPAEITGVPTQTTIDEVYLNNGIDPESGIVIINPITAKGRKPIGVFSISSLSINPLSVDLYFEGLSDTSVVPSIRTAVDNLLYNIRPFVAGADLLSNKNDVLSIGQIIAAVISVIANQGISYTNLTMEVDGVITNSFQFLLGYTPNLVTINNDGIPV